MTIIFRNPGLIDLNAVRTMGVNIKPNPGAFGYFGTGLKFALATVLRGGGSITLYRGEEKVLFRGYQRSIRDQPFSIVQMGQMKGGMLRWTDMGFTDQLGKNWEAWMVLRELGCNALDEQGTFAQVCEEGQLDYVMEALADHTTFVVEWDALAEAYKTADQIFFGHCTIDNERRHLISSSKLQIAEGQSEYLFYRGIRALKLERPSHFTYNILSEQQLSEDRQLAYTWNADAVIRQFWMRCDLVPLLREAITTGAASHEGHLRFDADEQTELSSAFVEAYLDLRDERNENISVHAKQAALKKIRSTSDQNTYYGGSGGRRLNDNLSTAIEALMQLTGSDDDAINWEDLQLVCVEDADSENHKEIIFCEKERLYIKASALRSASVRDLALALLKSAIMANWAIDPPDYLGRALLNTHRLTRIERAPEPEPAPPEDPTLARVLELAADPSIGDLP